MASAVLQLVEKADAQIVPAHPVRVVGRIAGSAGLSPIFKVRVREASSTTG